jgi:predicted TIM-barrel fold metal-dependent hydrolase
MDRYLVVSSDGHAGLEPEKYRAYLDPQYRDAFDAALPIQLEMNAKMEKLFLIDDINREWRDGRDEALVGAWDSDARNRVLDDDGIAAEVLFPDGVTERNSPPFGAGFSMPSDNVVPELQWAGARAHNRWMAEFVALQPERRIGLACVPVFWDIDESVREIEWAAANGLKGIVLPPMWSKQPPYHHPRYDPVWAACQANDMVIHFHSGPSPIEDYFGPMPPADDAPVLPGAMGIYVTEVHLFLVRPLTFMLWGGVFERFPHLKVAMTEGTSVWVPEYLELLHQRYAVTHYSQKLGDYRSHLSMGPAEYFQRNVMVGASCMPRREAELRYEIGVDNIMWGSDYPHPEGSWPYTRKQMVETFHGLPDAEIAQMLGGNAAKFYDLQAVEKVVVGVGLPVRVE